MPIWMRNFTFQKIEEYYDKENKAADKSQTFTQDNVPKGPAIRKADYSSKAPK